MRYSSERMPCQDSMMPACQDWLADSPVPGIFKSNQNNFRVGGMSRKALKYKMSHRVGQGLEGIGGSSNEQI